MKDEFEEKLLEITRSTPRADPTPAWKADILARARAEAPPRHRMLPPRALIAGWAVAWAAIVALALATPPDEDRGPAPETAASHADPRLEAALTPMDTSVPTLLAFERHYAAINNLQ